MIRIQNNSDTIIILVHEIYGINDHIIGECNRLAEGKYDVVCPNLLTNRQAPFSNSEELIAYHYFTQNIGFSLAQQQIEELSLRIRDQYRYCFIVGYSIGATIAWLCSQRKDVYSGVVGFYGSRIRDYKEIEPKCPVLLFFPRTEENFDVDCLMQDLSVNKNVRVFKADALHGFADPWSSKYCKAVSEKLFAKTIDFIDDQRQS
ncbi:MAG: DeoR family transcriptional regulator [Firmicutes bacterium]|nr:DeoR family transcriptional regulator [Bacillota bacterium]